MVNTHSRIKSTIAVCAAALCGVGGCAKEKIPAYPIHHTNYRVECAVDSRQLRTLELILGDYVTEGSREYAWMLGKTIFIYPDMDRTPLNNVMWNIDNDENRRLTEVELNEYAHLYPR